MYPLCIPTNQQFLIRKKKNFRRNQRKKKREKKKSDSQRGALPVNFPRIISKKRAARSVCLVPRKQCGKYLVGICTYNTYKRLEAASTLYSTIFRAYQLGTTDRSRVLFTRSLLIVYYNLARRTGEIYPTFPLRLLFSAS